MSKSKIILDKLTKIFEQGLLTYKDLSSEIINILKSRRDEIIFRLKLTSKEETEVLQKRVEQLEKKIAYFQKKQSKSKKVKKS
tara:strand:- start:1029 stop:1277 length:249 start_codon:yes stop_codon:yes gene_type:complete